MRRLVGGALALGSVLLVQLTVVNGVALPGGGTPDLVLLCVIALGLVGGPRAGTLTGFCAGLALDLAPPANELAGQYALVLCLVGYCCGRLRFTLFRSAVLALTVAAIAAVAGEALAAGLTLALDSPEVTWATVAHVLPASVLYDVAASPLILFVVVRVAVALGASLRESGDALALAPGGSAGPAGAAGPAGPRRAGLGVATGPGLRVPGGLRLAGDVTAAGTVGWLAGPARTRRARRAHARRTAMLTGATSRKGDVWVGGRPAGGTGSATTRSRPGVVREPAAVRLGLADQQRRRRRAAAAGLGVRGLGVRDLDARGLNARGMVKPAVPRIAFGGGTLARGHRTSPGRPAVPRIAFGGGTLARGRRTSPGRPAEPRFRSRSSRALARVTRTSPGQPAEPKFARAAPRYPAAHSVQRKIARPRLGHRSLLRLPGTRRAGGRSTVWRIGTKRTGSYR